MTTLPDPISWYEARAGSIADSYEALQPEQLHTWLEGLYPPAPALVLDVGAWRFVYSIDRADRKITVKGCKPLR